jgi:tetratricopeptide (TPR) repeat protein
MDLLDFTDCKLYFEDPLPAEAEALIAQAAQEYGEPSAELALLRAHLLAPENLTVLVGLYRYYFYQHRLTEALQVAERAMSLSGRHLGLPTDWNQIDENRLGSAAANSFGLLRFYLLALKAASVVLLRLGHIAASRARLIKLATLDSRDQLGAGKLLEVVDEFQVTEASTAETSNSTPNHLVCAA